MTYDVFSGTLNPTHSLTHGFVMASLRSRFGVIVDIIFCSCGFYLSSCSFFPCLFSAVGHWMSTIHPHIMWPLCEFRMHVCNVLQVARWKYRMQKFRKILPSAHHCTIVGYIFAIKAYISIMGKKLVKQQYLLHMLLQYGELRPTNGWGQLGSLGHPSKFQQVTAPTLLNRSHPDFARCLAICWAGTVYIHFRELLSPDGILPGAKFTLHPSLEFLYFGSVTAWHWALVFRQTLWCGTRNKIMELSQTAPLIWQGICPHF